MVFIDGGSYCGAGGASGFDFGQSLGSLWGPAAEGVT